jgi:hypothetical protein
MGGEEGGPVMFGTSCRRRVAGTVGLLALVVGPIGADAIGADALGAAAAGTPGAPRPPAFTFAGSGRATVYWSAPSVSGSAPISGYVVRPYLDRVPRPATTFHSTATHATVPGLVNGGTYTFTVAAVNAAGVGPQSAASPAVTVGTPSPPRAVSAQPGNRTATVSWLAPAHTNGAPITAYAVTPIVSGREQHARVFRSTLRHQVVTGLRAGRSYRFTVRAINRRGTGKSWIPTAPVTVRGSVPPPATGGGACPTARPASTYAGATLTVEQVLDAAYSAGFHTVAQLRAVVGIARAESSLTTRTRRWHPEFGCRPASDRIGVQGPATAWNPGHTRQMHSDRGLWQVSSHFWPEFTDAQTDSPRAAAAVVWEISRHGADFSPWNTWPSPAQSLAPSAATVQAFLDRQ